MVSASSNTARGRSRNDSAVPTGLAAEAPASPGTEVPGYSLCVPNGTQRPSSDDPADRPSPLGAPQVGLMLEGRQRCLSPFQGSVAAFLPKQFQQKCYLVTLRSSTSKSKVAFAGIAPGTPRVP